VAKVTATATATALEVSCIRLPHHNNPPSHLMSHPMHHDEANHAQTVHPSTHQDEIKMKTPLQLDNAPHHHPQCPYPHFPVFSKHTTRR
jgi:hypothetical protein